MVAVDHTARGLEASQAGVSLPTRTPDRVRWISHAVIWVVVVLPVIVELLRGWRALQDDASVSLRSYQVLSLHPPLVGQLSGSSYGTGHILYDPGPLQFFLLALPVHIDPLQGALWGAALVSGLVLSLAVEALWRTGHWVGCGVVALVVLDLAWVLPELFSHPVWNPYFAIPFLLTSMVLAFVVATGSLSWWPWLVFTTSVAVQSEVFFLGFALALLIVPPCLGVIRSRPKGHRWLVGGAIVGAVCWLPTALQEVFGNPGNLSLLLTAHRSSAVGTSYGLNILEFAGAPRPIWTLPSPILYARLGGGTSVAGLLLFVIAATVAFFAWKFKYYDLATLGLISVLLSLCTLVTFASIPANLVQRIAYLDRVLWLVGTLEWVVLIWAAVLITPSLVRYADRREMSLPTTITPIAARLTCGVALALLVLLSIVGVDALVTATRLQVVPHSIDSVDQTTKQIEALTSKGKVNIQFVSNLTAFEGYAIGQGIAWKLTTDGWQPQLTSDFTSQSGIAYTHSIYFQSVKVTLTSRGSRVALVHVGG